MAKKKNSPLWQLRWRKVVSSRPVRVISGRSLAFVGGSARGRHYRCCWSSFSVTPHCSNTTPRSHTLTPTLPEVATLGDTPSTLHRHSIDALSTLYRRSIDTLSTLYRHSIDALSTLYRRSIDTLRNIITHQLRHVFPASPHLSNSV